MHVCVVCAYIPQLTVHVPLSAVVKCVAFSESSHALLRVSFIRDTLLISCRQLCCTSVLSVWPM